MTAKDKRVGWIIETSDNSVLLLDQKKFRYDVPKFHIKQYSGYEVFLDLSTLYLGESEQETKLSNILYHDYS